MKKVVWFGLLVLNTLLAACGQDTGQELSVLRHPGAVPLATDVRASAKPLGNFAEVKLVTAAELGGLAKDGFGTVSYKPVPDELGGSGQGSRFRFVPPLCLLVLCDDNGNPVPESYDKNPHDWTVALDFVAVYATPALLKRAAGYGLSAAKLSVVPATALTKVIATTGLEVGQVGLYGPDSPWNDLCNRHPVPRICWVIDRFDGPRVSVPDFGGHIRDFADYGLVILAYDALLRLGDAAGELVQLHGEGLEPVVAALQVTLPEDTDKNAGQALFKDLYGEGQTVLARAGFVPVAGGAFDEVVRSGAGQHVVDALEYAR